MQTSDFVQESQLGLRQINSLKQESCNFIGPYMPASRCAKCGRSSRGWRGFAPLYQSRDTLAEKILSLV